jgi:preprotein translocase subunit SecF
MRKELAKLVWDFVAFYLRNYKKLTLIPLIILAFSISVLGYHYLRTGSLVKEDISLTGGWEVVVPSNVSLQQISRFSPTQIRNVFTGKVQGYEFELPANYTNSSVIMLLNSLGVSRSEASINYVSPSLAYSAIINAVYLILIAFVLVFFISFIYFRNIIQATANVVSIISDVINVLAMFSILGLSLSTASIAGLLMLMGYSADRNAILSTNIWKRKEGMLHYRLYHTFKTSTTMDLAAIFVLIALLSLTNNYIIRAIAETLLIGIIFDDLVVWILNGSLQLRAIKYG